MNMDDVVLVVCGGGAFRILDNARDKVSIPTVIINSNDKSTISLVPEGIEGCRGDSNLAEALVMENTDSISEMFDGKRIAILLSTLGGGTGTGMTPEIMKCAHDSGCKVVSMVIIPMAFEKERRGVAISVLPELIELSDRMFVLDLESANSLYPNIKFHNSLEVYSRTVAFAIENLYRQMDGPFFSMFSQKVYTFAYASEMDPVSAVTKAMEFPMVETDPTEGKLILFVGAGFGTAEVEMITAEITSMSGILPEIVKREDLEDTKLLMFLSMGRGSY